MTEDKTRFAALIDKELDDAKSGKGAYVKLYDQQKLQWLGVERDKILASDTLSSDEKINQINQLNAQFDERWDQNKDGSDKNSLKFKAMKAYEGESKDTQIENAANSAMDKAGNVIGGGVSSMLMGGDFAGGLSHGIRHAIMSLVMGIPFVGEFLGQAMSWMSSKVKSLFGGEEKSLSWSEAGEKVSRNKTKERIGASMGQYADPNRLAELVDEAAQKPAGEAPATGRATLDTNKDSKISLTELDVVKDDVLKSDDKDTITQQINDPEAARKLFEELGQQGVTFDNQKVSDLSTQSVPVAPAGSAQGR